MNAKHGDALVGSKLEMEVDTFVAPLAQDLRRACEKVDLQQIMSFSDLTAILIDRPYTVGETLRPCIVQWLASSFGYEIGSTSVRLAALVSGNGETSVAKVRVLLADKLETETYDAKAALLNRLSLEFFNEFCDEEGIIDWPKLVEFNSGNLRQ